RRRLLLARERDGLRRDGDDHDKEKSSRLREHATQVHFPLPRFNKKSRTYSARLHSEGVSSSSPVLGTGCAVICVVKCSCSSPRSTSPSGRCSAASFTMRTVSSAAKRRQTPPSITT